MLSPSNPLPIGLTMQSDKTTAVHLFHILPQEKHPKVGMPNLQEPNTLGPARCRGILVSHIGGVTALRRLGKQDEDTNCH